MKDSHMRMDCSRCEYLLLTFTNFYSNFCSSLITLVTRRKLSRVNFRKDFWDCPWGQRNSQWLTGALPEIDCSQSPIFPCDRRDRARLTVNGGHLDFQSYRGGGRRGL